MDKLNHEKKEVEIKSIQTLDNPLVQDGQMNQTSTRKGKLIESYNLEKNSDGTVRLDNRIIELEVDSKKDLLWNE